MPLVDKEALAGRHVPLSNGRIGWPGDDVRVVDSHGIDVARVASEIRQAVNVSKKYP